MISILSLLATAVASVCVVHGGAGSGGGWLVALPMSAHVAVTQTAKKLTRHGEYFNASVFWTVLGTGSGVAAAILISPVLIVTSLSGLLANYLCRKARAWKRRLQETGYA